LAERQGRETTPFDFLMKALSSKWCGVATAMSYTAVPVYLDTTSIYRDTTLIQFWTSERSVDLTIEPFFRQT
jgi:hypothetical protein